MFHPDVRALALATAALSLAPGCSFDLGLDGDWTRGERGRTRWQISDGLCPGFGGCALDVPLAVGAEPTLRVEGVDGRGLSAVGDDVIGVLGYRTSGEEFEPSVSVSALAPGRGVVSLRGESEEIDRVSIEVRAATALECGLWPTDVPLRWEMRDLSPTDSPTVPLAPGADDFYLACRARDERGPLLTVRAIEWTLLEGSDVLQIRSDGLLGGWGTTAEGARIRFDALAAGTARVRAQIGGVERTMTITVE
jgi:hypothetical protein